MYFKLLMEALAAYDGMVPLTAGNIMTGVFRLTLIYHNRGTHHIH